MDQETLNPPNYHNCCLIKKSKQETRQLFNNDIFSSTLVRATCRESQQPRL